MSASISAADAAACSSRSFEVQLLARRLEACAGQVEEALSRLSRLQLSGWQSPAGRAFRESAGLQAGALRRAARADGLGRCVRAKARQQCVLVLPADCGWRVLMAELTPSGSGGPLLPVEPASDGFLSVRGGVGGIAFQLEELSAGATELNALARDLAAVELDAHRVWTALGPYQNDSPSSGMEAVTGVWEGRRAVAAVREELQDIASQVQACQRDYEAAEQRSLAGLRSGIDALRLLPAQMMDLHLGRLGDPLRADLAGC